MRPRWPPAPPRWLWRRCCGQGSGLKSPLAPFLPKADELQDDCRWMFCRVPDGTRTRFGYHTGPEEERAMRTITVKCPKCRGTLEVDAVTGAVLRHEEEPKTKPGA